MLFCNQDLIVNIGVSHNETKHNKFKAYANEITSRKNIYVSLANKYQLKFENSFIQPEVIKTFEADEVNKIATASA